MLSYRFDVVFLEKVGAGLFWAICLLIIGVDLWQVKEVILTHVSTLVPDTSARLIFHFSDRIEVSLVADGRQRWRRRKFL